LITLSTFAQAPAAIQDPVLYLTQQNYRVLSGRVHKMLEYRLADLGACSAKYQEYLTSHFRKLPVYSDQRNLVLDTLDLYLESHRLVGPCAQALDKNENAFQKMERSQFSAIHSVSDKLCSKSENISTESTERSCRFKLTQILADLDPHCVSVQVPNDSNDYDTFPCMAADFMVGKSLVSDRTWESFLPRSKKFLVSFRQEFLRPDLKTEGIDLWPLYRQDQADTSQLREEFLAEINFFFSSFHSASSYIRGFHDHIWHFVLLKTGSADQALEYFISSRLIVDEFRTLHGWAGQHGIPMNLHGIDMAQKIRHNYMAAFLACHYREENRLIHESLPVMLGYTYESFDFKSHIIDEHLSFKASKENFITDTTRYRTGVYWGYRFCKMQF
jgi:hypothetical protein